MLSGKKILIGVTGGISAYKTAVLTRLFKKAGAEVKVLMTEAAKRFVQPLTFATLSQNPVYTDFFNPENGEWNSHVKLGLWADLFVIAPATANTIAKIAGGIADNLLTTTCLSARCKIMIAPAMDLDMYSNPATESNIETLKKRGFLIAEAGEGFLASGLSGKGRMTEPEEIFKKAEKYLLQNGDFKGKRVLITAGPTREKIDPVRFISNYSTGKMGYAIAEEFAERGAEVILVSGPVEVTAKNHSINVRHVSSAQEMYEECVSFFPEIDIAVMAAAVADFTPETTAESKIKKTGDSMTIRLKPTRDIAKKLGAMKKKEQILIGFALETDDELSNAQKKLSEKNFDFIVLNSLKDKGAGFGYDTNKITLISRNGIESFPLKSKNEVAKDIADRLKV
jgi:phosphopantothenoylcysteine decarboxylase/phosphopantothenate--cysteine ligase